LIAGGVITINDESKAVSLEAAVQHAFEQMIPFNRVLGLCVDALDPKAPRLRFDMRPELVGNPVRQILHGGVISATLDVVGGLAIALALAATKAGEHKADDPAMQPFPNIGTARARPVVHRYRPRRPARRPCRRGSLRTRERCK
jgi:acyl-coenzyme A thioesterase PaaI-like protein